MSNGILRMQHEIINAFSSNFDYRFVCNLIPDVMSELYNLDKSRGITLNTLRDAFRKSQMIGKQWLLNHIEKTITNKESKFLVVGGWLGFISYALHKMGYTNITEVDLDYDIALFSKHLNRYNNKFQHFCDDVNNIDIKNYDIIINTSCEHITNNTWYQNIKPLSYVFLHSTNLIVPDHVNLVKNITEMKEKYPCDITYSGELNCGSWIRYFIAGIK